MSDECKEIHELFCRLKRFTFPFNEKDIPLNGIYVLFEKGEKAHSVDRIVRVGTHTGKDQLRSRLKQHFISENKDRSIFRKNIGRALLNKSNDPFIRQWEIDLTSKNSRDNNSKNIDFNKLKAVEKSVTAYMQNNFSFVIFEVNDMHDRLELESKIISTISSCNECTSSKNWLGNHSPKEKIRNAGLWLVNELYKDPLTEKEFIKIKNILGF